MSGEWYAAEQEAVVCVRRSDWESVTERDEFVGRLRAGSRLPQYLCIDQLRGLQEEWWTDLMTAMLTGAVVLARYTFWSAMMGR